MRKESLNIAIACFIGGVLGVLVAKKIAEMYGLAPYTASWFIAGGIGALMGGAVAYLLYDPSAVLSAMRRAWYELADTENLKRWGKAALSGLWSTILLLVVLVAAFAAAGTTFLVAVVYSGVLFNSFGVSLAIFLSAFVGCLFFSTCIVPEIKKKLPRVRAMIRTDATFCQFMTNVAFITNPVTVSAGALIFAGIIVFGILCGIWWLAKGIPQAVIATPKIVWRLAVFTARFARLVFIYIHSTARIVCFVDTMIGAMVAYTFVSETLVAMFVGGTLGLIFGLLNYEFISVRWLKVAPAPSLTAGRRVRK